MGKTSIAYTIEEIARAMMCLSIRAGETIVTSAYLNEVEAGAKRMLRIIKEAREKNNKETKK